METESRNKMLGVPVAFATAAGASTVGAVIDTRGFESLTYLLATGTVTGNFSVLLEEAEQNEDGSNSGVYTAVPAELIIGDVALTGASDNVVQTVGSVGKGRYQRLTLIGAASPAAQIAITAVLGNAQTNPTVQ